MTTAFAILLLIWAAGSALATWRASLKDEPPVTINGMRRRRPHESSRAWAEGVRRTYRYMYALPVLLVIAGGVFIAAPEAYFWPAVAALVALVGVQMIVVLRLLNAAVTRANEGETMVASARGESTGEPSWRR